MKPLQAWKTCGACNLACGQRIYTRSNKLKPPVDAMFIGESVGMSEVVLKEPLVSFEGRLLQSAIDKVSLINNFSYVMTNGVLCAPDEIENHFVMYKPNASQAESCFFHIEDCIQIFKPRVVFSIGPVNHNVLNKHLVPHIPLKSLSDVVKKGGEGSLEYKKLYLAIQREIING